MMINSEAIQAHSKEEQPSLTRQLEIIGLSKTAYYYTPISPFSSSDDKKTLTRISEIYTKSPFYGHRRISEQLKRDGYEVGRKKVISAMKFMGIKAIYPEKKTTIPNKEHKKYSYLLTSFKNNKNQVVIDTPNKVWSTDISYIRVANGFAYLAAIIDWNTKKILSWKLSNTMDSSLTTSVLNDALSNYPKPETLNSDQGSQYTCSDHISILKSNGIKISMDGKGRSIDNIVIERFWRSIKYEDIYLNSYKTIKEVRRGIEEYIDFYNNERLHSSLGYLTPNEIYYNTYNSDQNISKVV